MLDRENTCIRLEHVTKKISQGKLVLDGADFDLKAREYVWISGNAYELDCLFDLLSGLQKADEGKIQISSGCVCAFVPPYFPALENMTVMDYMILSLKLSGKNGKCAKQESRHFLQDSYFAGKKSMKIEGLSYFEKCLLMFYMAFCQRPDVLVIGNIHMWLDENEINLLWKTVCPYMDETMAVLYLTEDKYKPLYFTHKYRFEHNRLRMTEDDEV